MTKPELLRSVKKGLNITGEYQDFALEIYINEVLAFLSDAGVEKSVLESDAVVGVVARGVSDLWNYGAGGTTFSPYFMQRAAQLAYKVKEVADA